MVPHPGTGHVPAPDRNTKGTDMGAEEKAALSVRQAARLLGIGDNLAFRMVQEGRIPSVRLGRRILVPRRALERMLESSDGHTATEEP